MIREPLQEVPHSQREETATERDRWLNAARRTTTVVPGVDFLGHEKTVLSSGTIGRTPTPLTHLRILPNRILPSTYPARMEKFELWEKMGWKQILSSRHGHRVEGAPTSSRLDMSFKAGLGGADVCWLERIDVTAGYGLVGGRDLWPVFRVVWLLGLWFQCTVQLVDAI
jgi:hypothetical protein